MKNKTEQVEIMTKALISRCHGLYSQEALGNEIMDFADRVVKLLTTPDVSKCEGVEREALLKLKQFVANQQDLPEDINQIVNDNFWELF